MKYFEDTAEKRALYAEERFIFGVTEAICEALERRGINRKQFAARLGVSPAEVTHRLNGERNLTLRSIAQMFHVLDFAVDIKATDTAVAAYAGAVHSETGTITTRVAAYARPYVVCDADAA